MLDLVRAQQSVDTSIQPGGYWSVDVICLRLAEETGEVCKAHRKESFERLRAEVGDVLFTVICLANKLGIDLDSLLTEKCEQAKERMRVTGIDPCTGRLQ
jgi:NTP pyrophosphatase (non-canonical NTP hydrolase)